MPGSWFSKEWLKRQLARCDELGIDDGNCSAGAGPLSPLPDPNDRLTRLEMMAAKYRQAGNEVAAARCEAEIRKLQ